MSKTSQPDEPATAADVLLGALIAGAIAGGHVAPDPKTGEVKLTPSGENMVRGMFPRNEMLVAGEVVH